MVIFVCQASTRSVNSSAILRRNFFKLEIPPPPGQTLAQTCAEASRNLHPQIMVVASGKLRPMEIPPQNVPSKIGFPERIKTTIMMVKPENLVFSQSNSRRNFCIGSSWFKKTLVFKSGQPETEIPPPSDSRATPQSAAQLVRNVLGVSGGWGIVAPPSSVYLKADLWGAAQQSCPGPKRKNFRRTEATFLINPC